MKNLIIKILCLVLSLSIMLFAFAACSQKNDEVVSSEPTSSEPSVEEPSDEPEEPSSEPEDTIDDSFDDEWLEDDFEAEEGVYYEPLVVNNEKYVNENFMGIGFIHQMFSYQNDKSGRVYNDYQRELELETMKKMNIKTIRAYYGADYSWDPVTHTRNFESEEMLGFYKACKAINSSLP